MSLAKFIHVVWSPATGPITAYYNPQTAHDHARTMVGVQVGSCEIREQLPDVVREDINSDYDGDDDTPVITIEEIDDPSEE